MKQTVDFSTFDNAFRNCNRSDNFTLEGLHALFDWLEDYEQETGEEIELDVIALCCDFSEYSNLEEFQNDYGAEEFDRMEEIEDNTIVIPVGDNGFIIQVF